MRNSRSVIILIIGVLSVVILIGMFGLCFTGDEYGSIKTWVQAKACHGNFVREIGTNKDLWLNGYLGIFFRFKMFGWLNWLAIPLFVYFLVTIRKRERWKIALCLALFFACIFICIKGYDNARYQVTLYPVLLTVIFLFGWQVLEGQNRSVNGAVVLMCSLAILMNLYFLKDNYHYYWNSSIGCGNSGEQFPYKMTEYIEKKAVMPDNSLILECNQPLLYYHTDKKGLSHRDKRMNKVYAHSANPEEALRVLRDDLKVSYIFMRGSVRRKLQDIINVGCELECEDQGYKLYRVTNGRGNLRGKDFDLIKPDFETNFSNWRVGDKVHIRNLANSEDSLINLGYQGEFIFKCISSDDGKIVRVKLDQPWFNKRPEIKFGFYIQPEGLRLKVKDGNVVSVVARVRLSKKTRRPAQIIIQDKNDYWSGETVYWKGDSWHDVVVSKKVRNGCTRICTGIYWQPDSTDEWLDVQSVRVYISDKDK